MFIRKFPRHFTDFCGQVRKPRRSIVRNRNSRAMILCILCLLNHIHNSLKKCRRTASLTIIRVSATLRASEQSKLYRKISSWRNLPRLAIFKQHYIYLHCRRRGKLLLWARTPNEATPLAADAPSGPHVRAVPQNGMLRECLT
jgi:hypothetical protein